jgi:hypothetical protein
MSQQVVARFQDGRLTKGISMDVDPTRPSFHIRTVQGTTEEIKLSDLKALFFVRSLEGNAQRVESRALSPGDSRARASSLISIKFADGEVMQGLTIRYPPNRPYFFVVPVDPGSNNIRILVNKSAVKEMTSPSAPAGGAHSPGI